MSGAQQYNTSSEEDVDDETQSRFVLVDDLDTLEVALDTLSGLDVQAISVDLEGTNLSRNGKVCILQIGLPQSLPVSESVYVVDVVALGAEAFTHCEEDGDGLTLQHVLEDPNVTKWMCDCRMDSDALYHQYGIACQNVIDLQLAEVATRRLTGDPAPRVMGLRGMLDKYLPVEDIKQLLPYRTKVEAVKQMFDSDPTAWEKRPLTESQVLYAATDVAHMGRLAEFVYEALPEDVQAKVQKVSTERVLWYKESDEKALFDGSERAIAPLF